MAGNVDDKVGDDLNVGHETVSSILEVSEDQEYVGSDDDKEMRGSADVCAGKTSVSSPEVDDVAAEGDEEDDETIHAAVECSDRNGANAEGCVEDGAAARTGGKLTAKQRRMLKKLKGKESEGGQGHKEIVKAVREMSVTQKSPCDQSGEDKAVGKKSEKKKEIEKVESSNISSNNTTSKKKFINKKKARR